MEIPDDPDDGEISREQFVEQMGQISQYVDVLVEAEEALDFFADVNERVSDGDEDGAIETMVERMELASETIRAVRLGATGMLETFEETADDELVADVKDFDSNTDDSQQGRGFY